MTTEASPSLVSSSKENLDKVVIMFKATGGVAALKNSKFKLAATATFQNVLDFLRKQLKIQQEDPLFLFVNSAFQPSPDETVGELFQCFQDSGRLVINYSNTQAYG